MSSNQAWVATFLNAKCTHVEQHEFNAMQYIAIVNCLHQESLPMESILPKTRNYSYDLCNFCLFLVANIKKYSLSIISEMLLIILLLLFAQ